MVEKQQTVTSTRRINKSHKLGVILGLAFIGWALCAAIMGIGMSITSLSNTLVVHAIGAPIIFALLSVLYSRKFRFTTPLITAALFTAFVIAMDFFVVALVIQQSLEMFSSILGTWLPFALIFLSTYLTCTYLARKKIGIVGIVKSSADIFPKANYDRVMSEDN